MKAARWGDNDRYLGPFTWSYSNSYPHWAIVLKSRGEENELCTLRISLKKATLIVVLPHIVRPYREKKSYNGGEYWQTDPRQYGVSLSDGHYTVYYGRVTHDSSTDQNWGGFLPWTQWRHVRCSLYGLDGRIFETVPESADYETWKAIEDACPAARFSFEDYDGKVIVATTRIKEREWLKGEGWFKWLSWFCRPKVRRTLDLSFSDEVGPEKGSWKGGMIGTSMEMLPGELHEAAFRRFCEQEQRAKGRRYRIKFVMAVK